MSASQLPPGWSKVESRSKPGRFYWFNENTGETSWKFPGAAAGQSSSRPLPSVPGQVQAKTSDSLTFQK